MSEFLAEARIIVRPDTSRFRRDLELQLKSVVATPIKIPVVPVIGAGFAAAAAGSAALASAQAQAAASTGATATALAAATRISAQYGGVVNLAAAATHRLAAEQEVEAISATRASAAQVAHARSLKLVTQGALSSSLSLFGVRGATLAASAPFLVAAASVVAFAKAVGSAAALETSLAVFRVTAEATADEMERMSASARELGRDLTLPGVTAGGAADAMTGLAKAGLSVQDALDAARGTLQLATAAAISNEEAVLLVSSALGAFELSGRSAVAVADLLAASANQSQGSITEMGIALQQSAAAAHQSGVELADTVSLLTILARAGLKGSDAGTSLRTAFIRLINPTTQAQKAIDKLGVDIRDLDGNIRPEVFADFTAKLGQLSNAQRDATLALIFGQDAFRAAAILGRAGTKGLDATREAVEKQGVAAEVAGARTEGLSGAAENLKNQFADLGLSIGNFVKGPATDLVNALSKGVSGVNFLAGGLEKLTDGQKQTAKTWAELTVQAGQFNLALAKFGGLGKLGEAVLAELNKGLVEQQGAGVAAASAIEEYRLSVVLAAQASEGLNNRLDESVDRFAKVAAAASAAASGPIPIGPGAKLEAGLTIAGAKDNLSEVEKLQKLRLERLQKALANSHGNVKQRTRLFLQIARAESDLISTQKQIASQAEAEQKAAATDAASATRKADQDFLDRLGFEESALRNKALVAAGTKRLSDDIKTQTVLRDFFRKSIALIKANVTDVKAEASAVLQAKAELIKANQAIKDFRQQQLELAREKLQRIQDSLRLDVDFSRITGNESNEIKAREALIKQLKKEQELTKRGTLEYKTLRNAIAEERAAIEDLRKEKQKSNQSFAQATFEFLQTQQGFASSLLGNLIPSGATGGLVGGSPVQGALQPVAGAFDAKSSSGITAGQGNTTNHFLARILEQLKEMNGEQKAPEAQRQKRTQGAVMDGVGGG